VSVLDVHLQVLPEFLNIYGLPVELLFSLVGVGVRVSEMTSNDDEGLVTDSGWCTQVKHRSLVMMTKGLGYFYFFFTRFLGDLRAHTRRTKKKTKLLEVFFRAALFDLISRWVAIMGSSR
jgi:hypothetical protein